MQLFFGFLISAALLSVVQGTSMKIDFLRLTNVRTDPITHPNGPSFHVHSFFGAAEAAPQTSYQDLRNSKGNTGNIKENKSLYWHPTIYKYNKKTKTYTIQETSLFSTYYIWETGKVKAFPDGLKMIGGGDGYKDKSFQFAECVNPGKCPNGDCERWNDFFPATTCEELEMSMRMPDCWDGKNLDSADHRSHVAYSRYSDPSEQICPKSHPVKMPQIRVFTRIQPYTGGIHVFSDGTGLFHADYFSGWEASFLQKVLDECENDSFDAMPTSWCEDHVTFRDAPKNPKSNEVDKEKLKSLQPKPFNGRSLVNEPVNNVRSLPGNIDPLKSTTPRCIDPKQGSKAACKKLRFKKTGLFQGNRKLEKKKACTWKKSRCLPVNPCKFLKKSKRLCEEFGMDAGCVWERNRCIAEDR